MLYELVDAITNEKIVITEFKNVCHKHIILIS